MRPPLKLMTFNILLGGGEDRRFSQILDVLRRCQPDILVLQECLGWEDGVRLAQVEQVLQAQGRLGQARPRGSGKCYHLAAFSKLPMQDFQVHNDPSFLGHALIQFRVDWGGEPLTVFGAHFDAKNENLRFVEARYLASRIDPKDFEKGLYALLGDLNSLSSHDPYPADLEALLRQSLTTKYHLPPRFEVMTELAEFGWEDGLHLSPPARWVTAHRDRGGVQIDYRTDYLLLSPALAARTSGVEVVPLSGESDHNPVLGVLL